LKVFLAFCFLALCAAQASAQTNLKLPTSQGEIRSLMKDTADPVCLKCGVVTSIELRRGVGSGPTPDVPAPSGTPFPTDTRYRPSQQLLAPEYVGTTRIATYYEVIVKYDDGSYGRHELKQDPKLQKGTRVKVESGNVVRYP